MGDGTCRACLLAPALIQAGLGVGAEAPSKGLTLWGAPQQGIG